MWAVGVEVAVWVWVAMCGSCGCQVLGAVVEVWRVKGGRVVVEGCEGVGDSYDPRSVARLLLTTYGRA